MFSYSSCQTLDTDSDSRAKIGVPCVFPFTYKGVSYSGCTADTDPDGQLWCATRVDKDGNYVSNSGQYGHCNQYCPVDQPTVVREVGNSGSLLDLQSRCPPGSKCMLSDKCKKHQDIKVQLATLTRGSTTYQQKLLELKDSVCNYPNKGVCCPDEEQPQQLKGELGDSCAPGQRCVPLPTCPALQALASTKTTENIEKVKSLICNKEKKMVCCEAKQDFATETSDLSDPAYLPNPETLECGTNIDTSRIIGGEITKPGTYPSAALLGKVEEVTEPDPFIPFKNIKRMKTKFVCGGTLINRWYVLTAAHCEDSRKRITKVVLGDWDTNIDPDCGQDGCLPRVQEFFVEKGAMIVHPGFKIGKNVLNDIALVKLDRPARLDEDGGVQPACLPLDPALVAQQIRVRNLRDGMVGKKPIVVGWGFTEGDPLTQLEKSDFEKGSSSASQYQMHLPIPVISNQECLEKFNYNLDDSQICAGGEKGKDSCKGDSGGPLYMSEFSPETNLIVSGNVPWYLFGLVSYGSIVCGNGRPGVYTRVESFIPWIRETISKN